MDTNVIISAFRSRRGASHLLLNRMGTGLYRHAVTTAIVLEMEELLLREASALGVTSRDVEAVVDYIVSEAVRVPIHYRWRPFLKDPDDECILEGAVAAGAEAIVTYNLKDFLPVERAFGIRVLTARQFLQEQGVIP